MSSQRAWPSLSDEPFRSLGTRTVHCGGCISGLSAKSRVPLACCRGQKKTDKAWGTRHPRMFVRGGKRARKVGPPA
jgi:hypothetical protein